MWRVRCPSPAQAVALRCVLFDAGAFTWPYYAEEVCKPRLIIWLFLERCLFGGGRPEAFEVPISMMVMMHPLSRCVRWCPRLYLATLVATIGGAIHVGPCIVIKCTGAPCTVGFHFI